MGVSSPMRKIGKVGRFSLYYAERGRFVNPGYVLWTGRRHVRVWPLPIRAAD